MDTRKIDTMAMPRTERRAGRARQYTKAQWYLAWHTQRSARRMITQLVAERHV